MQRTIRLKLEPSLAQAKQLAETSRQFTAVFNAVCALGWREHLSNGIKLHHATYYPLKADYPALVSDLHIQARVKATEAVKSALTLHKAGRTVSQPRSAACPPRYNVHTFRVDWESRTVRLSLVGGRQTIRFHIPHYSARYAGHPTDTADLLERDGVWWLHVVVTVPAPQVEPTEQVVGVDLGLSRPAVTSTHRFLGKRAWKALEGRLFKLKRALQQRGTKSAKRHLKRVRHKQARFRRNADHILSKQIVAAAEPGATIVLENLKDIRRRARMRRKTEGQRRIHSWSFAQLRGYIAYKAEERGVWWSRWTRDIPPRRAAGVGIPPATTAVPATCLCAVRAASRCTPTSTGRGISRPSTVLKVVHPPSAGCRSTSLPCPLRRLSVRIEAQAVAFTRQLLTQGSRQGVARVVLVRC